MNWFNEQVRYREQKDTADFEGAIDSIAGAIMGRRLSKALDEDEITQSAIDEILKYFHCKYKEDVHTPQFTDMEEKLDYILRPYGLMRRTVSLENGWYKNAFGPMLGTLKADGSAVALIPGKFSGYYIYDYSTGRRNKLNSHTEDLLDEEAILFYKPLPLKKMTFGELVKFVLEQFKLSDILYYIILTGILSVVGLLSPLFTKWLFGNVLESGSMRMLMALSCFMLSYVIALICFTICQKTLYSKMITKQNVAVKAAVMMRILSLPATFYRNYAPGELNQRAEYVQMFCTSIMTSFGQAGLTSLFSLIYIAQVFVFAPSLVVPSIIVTLSTVTVTIITSLAQMKITKEQMLNKSKTSGLTYATITGIQKIKMAGAEKRMFSRWARQYSKEAELTYNPPLFIRLCQPIVMAINLTGTIVLYYLAVKNSISVSSYYAFNASYANATAAFTALASIVTEIANIKPTLDMIRPLLDEEPEISKNKERLYSLRGKIELSNVCFRYSDDMPNVLDEISLKIKPGEYVAIVGPTGCGKSTLLRLLLGFETPQRGAVYYDDKDISSLDLSSLRSKIGSVMQDGKLFLGDIYSNIVISAPQLTEEDAWEAAEIASIADDIRRMPMGMHTIISEGQGGISGGQKQRLMIARAIAPRPRILLFDEATSALDNVTQKNVSKAIDNLKCTRIVIAHRLSTIKHCDRIIVMNKGNIIENGTYEELIALNGFFADLVSRQRLDDEATEY